MNVMNVCFENNKVDLMMLGDFNINYAKPSYADTQKLKALERKFPSNKLYIDQQESQIRRKVLLI